MEDLLRGIQTYWYRVGNYNPVVVLVELLLIGVVVWWTMRFLRGTRGARIVKGAALVLAVVYLVLLSLPKRYEWDRVTYLYGNFLLFAFVAFVVAFQPELRRALIQLGQAHFFRGAHGRVEEIADALVDSAQHFSRNKIGSLVALERSVGLATWAASGTPLDARLTAPLLNSIFYPGSALHDMGVVVSGGRVAAAGCQFPLADSDEVDPSLGSRHRAALGLAKESDALVLVVSEETGRISLAFEGQLYIGLEPGGLREMLISLLSPALLRGRRRPESKPPEAPSE
ncbi:MAG: diadenylate cyclase [Planctomycetota bacterium]|nr:diadenylate cyclase [Planctomycetota bacterium]